MKRVNKKNISSRVADVRSPDFEEEKEETTESSAMPVSARTSAERFFERAEHDKENQESFVVLPQRRTRGVFAIVAVLGVLGVVFVVGAAYYANDRLIGSASLTLGEFQGAARDFNVFDPKTTGERFASLGEGLRQSEEGSRNGFSGNISDILGALVPFFKEGGTAIRGLGAITTDIIALTGKLQNLGDRWLNVIVNTKEADFLPALADARTALARVNADSKVLSSVGLQFKDLFPSGFASYLPLQLELERLEGFFGALYGLLSSAQDRHMLVLFMNNSEMRPGGGFIGSYADLTIRDGVVASLDVHDINDPDRELEQKTVPPEPLQVIVKNWRAADGNWFFDFSDSAATVISFLEASRLYRDRGITFDGIFAFSPAVARDVLAMTGPLQLRELGVTITSDNFLREIQRYVESARARKSSEPKKIMQALTARLLEELSRFTSSEKNDLARTVGKWLAKKDAMVYFKDSALRGFFDHYGWSGKVFALPLDFRGDYLAVVGATIGGEKSELFVDQNVVLESHINEDGVIANRLTVSRRHRGNTSTDWWYRAQNQNYLRVMTPPLATLTGATGGLQKTIRPPLAYASLGYTANPLVKRTEETKREYLNFPTVLGFEEYGKNVFATWSRVDRGKTTTLTFDYVRQLSAPLRARDTYQFVFEKQAGMSGAYHFEINAPLGFIWQESKKAVFVYDAADPDSRVTLNLTLLQS